MSVSDHPRAFYGPSCEWYQVDHPNTQRGGRISDSDLTEIQFEGVLFEEATGTGVVEGDDGTLIKNCLLCGKGSANGYVFAEGAFGTESDGRVVELYENAPVFLNHSSRDRHPMDRGIETIAGKIVNVRLDSQGRPRGDIDTTYGVRGAEALKLAKGRFKRVGLSQTGRYKFRERAKVVERVEEVYSVDIVLSPATTKSFYESTKSEKETQELDEAEKKTLEDKLKAAVERAEAAEKRVAEISVEKKELSEKVAAFESEKKAAETQKAVLEALKAVDLDPADKDMCSEAFIATLCEADADRREALIADRAALVKKVKETSKESKEDAKGAKERKEVNKESWDVNKTLDGDIFA